jgi:O-antigen/teichoic acid export membrane protein
MNESGNRWRLTRPVGVALIILGVVGMLAVFPFIYGDPGPGQVATDRAWFRPVATGLLIVLGLGIVLVSASPVHRLIRRRRQRP